MIFFKKDLLGLDQDGSPCEACGKHMHKHDWVDLDINGFVTWCNFVNDVQEAVDKANELEPEQSEGNALNSGSVGMDNNTDNRS